MIDDALRAAYRATRFVVTCEGDEIVLRVDQPNPALDALLAARGVTQGAIITAWNPRSQWSPPAENEARGRELAATVAKRGLASLPSIARGDEARWTEPGLLVLGIAPEDAAALGRDVEQNAVVTVTRGEPPRLVWCVSPDAAS